MGTAKVVARIERDAETLDIVAEHNRRIGIFTQPTDLALQADSSTFHRGKINESPQPFDFFIERSSQFAGRQRQRDHFGCLGQLADCAELPIVIVTSCRDIHSVGDDVLPMRVSAERHGAVKMSLHFRGTHLVAFLVDHDFDAGILQIGQAIYRFLQGQVTKTLR